MPSSSINRLTKLKSVSRYCTQYIHFRYVLVSSNLKSAVASSANTCLTMSGTVISWKIRQSLVRVSNQSHGRTTAT